MNSIRSGAMNGASPGGAAAAAAAAVPLSPKSPGSGRKKRGALTPIDINSPVGFRSASPGRKRQRRHSSFNKRVSFGGQQIKVYNRHDEEWKSPSFKATDGADQRELFDEMAEDTVTMPSLVQVLEDQENRPQLPNPTHPTPGPTTNLADHDKENDGAVPKSPLAAATKWTSTGVFLDDDILRGGSQKRLSQMFETEDTETITLGGISRQNSDLSEGDITRNIPSLADLVAGAAEAAAVEPAATSLQEDKDTAANGGGRRNSGLSDESDSFDRMYGKVFGNDATEDDLTNFTAATNASLTHNITRNIPGIGSLLQADREAEPTPTSSTLGGLEQPPDDLDDGDTQNSLHRSVRKEEPKPLPSSISEHGTEREDPPTAAKKEASFSLVDATIPPADDDENVTREIPTFSSLLKADILSQEGLDPPQPPAVRPRTTTTTIAVAEAEGTTTATTAPTTTTTTAEREVPAGAGSLFTFKDFLHNANLRFLDDLSSRRQRETSFGDNMSAASPHDGRRERPGLSDRLKSELSLRTTLTELNLGAEKLERANLSMLERTTEMERKIERDRPFAFARMDASAAILRKEEISDLQVALKRLKNFCRLLAKQQWYDWRGGFEASIQQKLDTQRQILSADISVLQDATQTLKRMSDATDADAKFWNLKTLGSGRDAPIVPATLLDDARSQLTKRHEMVQRLQRLRTSKSELVAAQATIASETHDLQSQLGSLSNFSGSMQRTELAIRQARHLNRMLFECSGIYPTLLSSEKVVLKLNDLIQVRMQLQTNTIASIHAESLPTDEADAGESAHLAEVRTHVTDLCSAMLTKASAEKVCSKLDLLRSLMRFVASSSSALHEAETKANLLGTRAEEQSLVLNVEASFSRLATRRSFAVGVEWRIPAVSAALAALNDNNKPSAEQDESPTRLMSSTPSFQVKRVTGRIGTAPSVEEVQTVVDSSQVLASVLSDISSSCL